jgi:hypothetical protein
MQISVSGGILIRRANHRKQLDVHEENSEERPAAKHVQRNDALRFFERAGSRR